jgi:ABC-type branched-subunit amino acid transport system substrate-binding protein
MKAVRLVASLACMLAAGCTFLLNPAAPVQCASQADCTALGLADRVCTSGFCMTKSPDTTQVSNTPATGCVTTEQCTQANSNKLSVCRTPGTPCVEIETPLCAKVGGHWEDPNAIVIGAIVPMKAKQPTGKPGNVDYGVRVEHAMMLAFEEISDALPSGVLVGNERRQLAYLGCDSREDAATAKAVYRHLVDDARAQAVLVSWDADLANIATDAAQARTAIACSDCLSPLPKDALAWRILPSIANEVPVAAWRIEQLAAARKAGPTPPTAPLKIVMLQEPTINGKTFVARFADAQGKGSDDLKAATVVPVVPEDPLVKSVNHALHVKEVLDEAPDIIVAPMGPDFATHYLLPIETGWDAATGGKPKPKYVLTSLEYEIGLLGSALSGIANEADREDLRKRLSGTRPYRSAVMSADLATYRLRYKTRWNGLEPDGNETGYEAMYALAYAVLAGSTTSLLDGPHVSSGFERLSSGPVIPVGPQPLAGTAISALLNGQSIALRGLASTLGWEGSSRDLVADEGMYCLKRDGSGNLLFLDDAGVRYSPKDQKLVASETFGCD